MSLESVVSQLWWGNVCFKHYFHIINIKGIKKKPMPQTDERQMIYIRKHSGSYQCQRAWLFSWQGGGVFFLCVCVAEFLLSFLITEVQLSTLLLRPQYSGLSFSDTQMCLSDWLWQKEHEDCQVNMFLFSCPHQDQVVTRRRFYRDANSRIGVAVLSEVFADQGYTEWMGSNIRRSQVPKAYLATVCYPVFICNHLPAMMVNIDCQCDRIWNL